MLLLDVAQVRGRSLGMAVSTRTKPSKISTRSVCIHPKQEIRPRSTFGKEEKDELPVGFAKHKDSCTFHASIRRNKIPIVASTVFQKIEAAADGSI